MKIQLDSFTVRHPKIPPPHAADMVLHLAVALERYHAAGVHLQASVMLETRRFVLAWRAVDAEAAAMLDTNRATEMGAESLLLLVLHATKGWTVRRRLPRGAFADWLLSSPDGLLIALETSGTNDGSAEQRMKEKLSQISGCVAAPTRVAGVVRFLDPRSIVEEFKDG